MSQLSYPPLSASLIVKDAKAAIDFYQRAFGATERYHLTDPSNGAIGHAELDVNGSMFMVGEEGPKSGKSPKTLGGTPVKFCLMVDDADALFDQAIAAGATSQMPMTDMFYGYRTGSVVDPFGHEWLIQALIEEVSPEEMQRRWNEMGGECKKEDT
ncbi:VOC family protein [Luteolibacter soli]|uniref:VOC family protein n=1 Tax=Luteolibacter soli TaxID=3135280 RepID=A0ABU9AZ67_9BACT